MSDTNNVDAKGLDLVDDASKVQEEDNPSVEDPKHSDLNEENPMPSPQQEVYLSHRFWFNFFYMTKVKDLLA